MLSSAFRRSSSVLSLQSSVLSQFFKSVFWVSVSCLESVVFCLHSLLNNHLSPSSEYPASRINNWYRRSVHGGNIAFYISTFKKILWYKIHISILKHVVLLTNQKDYMNYSVYSADRHNPPKSPQFCILPFDFTHTLIYLYTLREIRFTFYENRVSSIENK